MKTSPEMPRFMTAINALAALSLALCATTVAAETVYKYRRADGTVVYSDAPVKDAKLVGRYMLLPLPAREPATGKSANKEGSINTADSGVDERARQRSRALEAADAEIKAADLALKAAQERQVAGEAPLPGERAGIGQGRSRLRPEYFARQRQLSGEVEAARIRLEEAYRQRDELRE